MDKRCLFVLAASVLGAGAARAELLHGGPVYGGPAAAGGIVTCRVFNMGPFSSTLSAAAIFDNTGASAPLTSNTCNGLVTASKYCAFSATVAGNLAYTCRAYSSGVQDIISGTAEIRTPAGVIITSPFQH